MRFIKLSPTFKGIENKYDDEFVTMANVDVSLSELLDTRAKLVKEIKDKLKQNDKKFLISFVSNSPGWSKFRDSKTKDYPSIKWKMMNQKKMSHEKLEIYIELVIKYLSS